MTFNVPKLSPVQWLTLGLKLYPYLKALSKALQVGYVEALRYVVELIFQMQDLFPGDGQGPIKLATFVELFKSALYTAAEKPTDLAQLEEVLSGVASVAKDLLKGFGYFAKTNVKPAK